MWSVLHYTTHGIKKHFLQRKSTNLFAPYTRPHFWLSVQVGNGEFEVIRRQGFASNKVEIRIKLRPVIWILTKTSN